MTAGAPTALKVAGGFWIALLAWSIFTNFTFSDPIHTLPAQNGRPAVTINLWPVIIGLSVVELFALVVGLGMVLSWPWVRGWAKLFGWVGIFTSIFCCIPTALYDPHVMGALDMVALRVVLTLIMSIVTLWALKETA